MRTCRGMPLLVGGIGLAVVLVCGFVSCTFFGSTGATPSSGSVSSSSGSLPSWLASALSSPGDSMAMASAGASASSGSGDVAAASATSSPTYGPRLSVQPTSRATAVATATPRPVTPAPTTAPTSGAPCYIFPSSNVWNQPVSGLPVASNSEAMISAIGSSAYLHPDFDAIGDGIPYNMVSSSTPTYNVSFDYADESDPGPYPIPSSPRIEGGSDAHLLAIDLGQCKLWELYDVRRSGSGWAAGSGAVFDLRSNALRPEGWTSADAAGLPIFPGLVRYEEVMAGEIDHAIRFTAPSTCGYIYPARHLTADPCSNLPPMGLRVRLKASVDISGFGPHAQVVLTALKRYGMILADNGSPWYISGVPNSSWDDDEFHKLQTLHGSDFEVVDTSGLRNG